MEGILPTPQYEYDAEWRWPWWQFELMPDLLFTTLHQRFNTRVCPIQDPQSFVCDVRACAIGSPDVDTFYARLAERRDQRVAELEAVWSEVCSRMRSKLWSEPICGNPDCKSLDIEDKNPDMKNDKRFARSAALAHLSRTMAFDCLIDFFDGFVRDDREKEKKRSQTIEDARPTLELAYDNPSVGPAQTPPADRDDASPGKTARQTPPQPSQHRPPTPSPSPKSTTTSDPISAGTLIPDRKDDPNFTSTDEPATISPPRGHGFPPLESGAATQAGGVSRVSQGPPDGQPSRARQKRKRSGLAGDEAMSTAADAHPSPYERTPAKRRATRRVAAARQEGPPPRRSTRLAG